MADGSKLVVQDRNLQLLNRPDFSNIRKTHLDVQNEVGKGNILEQAQTLSCPQPLLPLQ